AGGAACCPNCGWPGWSSRSGRWACSWSSATTWSRTTRGSANWRTRAGLGHHRPPRRRRRPAACSEPEGDELNTFGHLFRVTTFGESHGPAIGCVVDGCPPGIALAPEDFAHDLARRATGRTRHTSARREDDAVEILSGVYAGLTTGTPIALLVRNTDAGRRGHAALGRQGRPGHADYAYWQKYGIRDPRGGGRSSARETTMRVAAGVIAKKWLASRHGVRVRGHLAQIGEVMPRDFDWNAVEGNPFFWPD